MCELARNSVIQSGFEMSIKKHWLGKEWFMPGRRGNDIHKTNVPDIRMDFRYENLLEELKLLSKYSKSSSPFVCNTIHLSSPQPGARQNSILILSDNDLHIVPGISLRVSQKGKLETVEDKDEESDYFGSAQ
ncbi:1343_t:CDS:2 [Racocetra fulgida]|uniref:1343_t:CDS:1 n=1 Tax=Racocetra fulgida TaxID=60492 RepID=A0A9N9ALR5_9GLOM|nr:1343_t:CDS:2 [Racocetra fulgida]